MFRVNAIKRCWFLVIAVMISTYSLSYSQSFQKQGGKYYFPIAVFQEQINEILADPNFAYANIGVYIKSLDNSEVLYSYNKEKLFQVASDVKLFTSAAALSYLGSDFEYVTEVYQKGKIIGNVLKGDLIIFGTGDPTFSDKYYNNKYGVFEQIADSLLKLGVEEISGNLIADDSYFDNVKYGKGWPIDLENQWFAAPIGSLSINENCIDVVVKPSQKGKAAIIEINPQTKYLSIENKTETVEKNKANTVSVYREKGSNVITVYGNIPEDADPYYGVSTINNPTQNFIVLLKETLERKGIRVKGYAAGIDDEDVDPDYEKLPRIAIINSPDLREILKEMNKHSNNFYAEQLIKTIGAETEGEGTFENGYQSIIKMNNKFGINREYINLADGSGLSHLNLVSPVALVELLGSVYKQPYMNSFITSLPVMGVDGTLMKRLENTKAKAKIVAKPGYNIGVRSLSGYATTADGEELSFSIIINNYLGPATLADKLQDEICLRMVNFTRK